jgi:hypothetical protein
MKKMVIKIIEARVGPNHCQDGHGDQQDAAKGFLPDKIENVEAFFGPFLCHFHKLRLDKTNIMMFVKQANHKANLNRLNP